MSEDLPFYAVMLDLRVTYDALRGFLHRLLDEEVTAASFVWAGDRLEFNVHLRLDSEDIRKKVLQGVYFFNRTVTGSIDPATLRQQLGADAETLLRSLDEIRMLDSALAELQRAGDDPSQALGNSGFVFSMTAFDVSYRMGPFRHYYNNWGNRKEVKAAAVHHYQARMAIGRQELDPVDENASVYTYPDGSPSPWGEEQ